MACDEMAVAGRHNCRNCSQGRSSCLWHGIPTSSIRGTFRDIMVRAFEDPTTRVKEVRFAELIRLDQEARSSMLERPRGEVPLDDRSQLLIDAAAKIARY
jgi:hypothetical protein